ncbi:MAG: class I SAM-dependent methyltransferase [Actinomycetota bacterium]|nr:class I SAM-dependent methyltransferase [Actinomycetota bacterium]
MTGTTGDIWDRRFAERDWPGTPDPYLVEFADPLPPGNGLDLGAGPGRNSLWLAAKGWAMTLVDLSRIGLEQAAQAAKRQGATFGTVHADVSSWRAQEGGFDLVIVANVHLGTETLSSVLDGAAHALRPGGNLYVVGHHISNLGRHGPPSPERLFTEDRLRRALPPNLRTDVLETRERKAGHETGRVQLSGDAVVLAWATKLVNSGRGN